MLEAYTKDGSVKKIPEENDIIQAKNIKFLKFNNTGNKYRIKLNITKNGNDGTADKAVLFVFGSNNSASFAAIIYVFRNATEANVNLLCGNTSVANVTQLDDVLSIRLNTNIYGTLGVISTCEIVDVFGEN